MRRVLIIAMAIVGIVSPVRVQQPDALSPHNWDPHIRRQVPAEGQPFRNRSRRRIPVRQIGSHPSLSTPIRPGQMQDGIAGPADEAGAEDGAGSAGNDEYSTQEGPPARRSFRFGRAYCAAPADSWMIRETYDPWEDLMRRIVTIAAITAAIAGPARAQDAPASSGSAPTSTRGPASLESQHGSRYPESKHGPAFPAAAPLQQPAPPTVPGTAPKGGTI
jgi:hypothetical protein